MNNNRCVIILLCSLICLFVAGCKSNKNGSVWDDNQTAGNYKGTARTLWNNMIGNDQEDVSFFGPIQEDFIALNDEDLKKTKFSDGAIPQPKLEPGEKGSGVPGIEGFRTPFGELAAIFKNVHFNTDDHIIRNKESLALVERVADYLKSHKHVYVFIEGHCDQRGPEAYNLSLGARRANSIRSLLVQKGVDSERIHTVSYGKERPADRDHNAQAWTKNRRAEFKIFQRT